MHAGERPKGKRNSQRRWEVYTKDEFKHNVMAWIELIWLRKGISDGLL
jgi:hypothetical protein